MRFKDKKTLLVLLILFVVSFFSFWRLLRPGYFSMQDDVQVFRLQQFDQCLKDGQIPCRYISQGGFGYGYPLYNFYSPLPYFLGEVFHLLGFSFINSVKILFILGFVFSALGMFLWARLFWGDWGGLLASVFYLLAPYHALDSYVRGALAEFLALAIFPFGFWLTSLWLREKKAKYGIGLAFSLGALFLTHNLSALVFLVLLTGYFLFSLIFVKEKKTKLLIEFIWFLILSVLMASFFLLPLVFEKKLVTLETMTQGYFDFRGHFVSLKQLFLSRNWGYGASLFGTEEDISFQIGILHWLVLVLTSVWFLFSKKRKKEKAIFFFFLGAGFLAAFLTHSRSIFLWRLLPFLAYFQFPWRFLMVVILGFSFSAGAFIFLITSERLKKAITLFLVLSVVLINFNYFKEDIWFSSIKDQDKLAKEELIRQSGAGLRDYWPVFGETYPKDFASSLPWFEKGEGEAKSFQKKSHRAEAEISVFSDQGEAVFPIVYFPNWEVKANNQEIGYNLTKDLGLIKLNLEKGDYELEFRFYNTPIRTLANLISLGAMVFLFFFCFKRRKK